MYDLHNNYIGFILANSKWWEDEKYLFLGEIPVNRVWFGGVYYVFLFTSSHHILKETVHSLVSEEYTVFM